MIDKLILGTVQLGLPYGINNKEGQPSPLKAQAILKKAFECGIRHLDTAEAYGSSQQIIGQYHRQADPLKHFNVITKYAEREKPLTSGQLYHFFLDNLTILGIEGLESYLFHSFESYRMFNHWEVFEKLMKENKLRSVGVSVYTNAQAGAAAVDPRVQVVQLPFNMLDNNSHRAAVLNTLKEKGKEVHARSAFLQGLFFKDRKGLGRLEPLGEGLARLDRIATGNGLDTGTMALAYCLRQPLIDKVLIGVETEDQLGDNIASAEKAKSVDKKLLEEIDGIRVGAVELLNPVNWK